MRRDEEIELKLLVDRNDIATLLEDPLVTEHSPASRDHVSTYFDTERFTLLSAGLSLRIRQSGDRRVQTVKAESSSGSLLARGEWEKDVTSDRPILDDGPAVLAVALQDVELLQPVFTVEVNRTSAIHADETSRIELVVDQGQILATDRSTAISEVEIELLDGDRKALFALARRIADRMPLRLGVQGKSERGYDLLRKETLSAKAEPITLPQDIDTATLFEIVAGSCLRQIRRNEDKLLATGSPAALHQARVGLRRLRSALSIFKPMLIGSELDRFQNEFKELAALLGKVRDIDVMIEKIVDENALDHLGRARASGYEAAVFALESIGTRRLMLDFVEWISVGGWRENDEVAEIRATPAPVFASEILDRFRLRIKRRGKNLAKLSEEERHRVRIAGKKLRYSAEFFADLYTERKVRQRREAFLAALEDLQSALGHLNDLASGRALLEELGIAAADSILASSKKGDTKRLLLQAEEAHARLTDIKRFW